jgi:hypothetical protein
VPSCCYPDEYGAVFTAEEAAAQAKRYRRNGLTGSSAALLSLLQRRGIAGAAVLEVGAGVGDVLVAVLERGAARVIDVDLSASWVEAARAFVAEYGHAERFDARSADFVDIAPTLPEVDVVILNRVVCCYPDWSALLDAAAGRSRDTIAATYPADRWWTRAGVRLANLWFRLRGLRFRVFVHPEAAMTERLAAHGFAVAHARTGPIWRTVVFRRGAAA